MREYKIVVLGSGGVGKSCLTVQFVQGIYVETYDPTIEDSYRKQIEIDDKVIDLEILDTAGVQQFTAMRELYIKSGKGFLLVYSVDDPNSLKELERIREQVLRIKDNSNMPIVLVGNKSDLVETRKLTPQDGIEKAANWNCSFYETSALNKSNVDNVFVNVVEQIIRREETKTNGTSAGNQVSVSANEQDKTLNDTSKSFNTISGVNKDTKTDSANKKSLKKRKKRKCTIL
ncbi:BA75_02242T0 [Komagataella pastoris]|uniref:small monomeric GTPase n=1 Tax=Komagataella pastoris TaxID=4922 RepID=A0A1B2JD29_PICPA|nr:BA75_02242T0 [Komagataella pastoris]